ncbi:MAG TPA: ATP-dependent metallopeptidase FtsH/Yme1/Tma family protein, partial [Candidatus Acidoferrales bacterium]|nr:ATP-dependent metallopeptidase FtsH/Yme1/Tma family protein [Candidatus Acidoferrales bacterium]
MNSTVRTILFWVMMIALAAVLWQMASRGGPAPREEEANYSNFLDKVSAGSVKTVTIMLSPNSAELQGDYKDGTKFHGVTVANTAIPDVTKLLGDQKIPYNYKEVKEANWLSLVITLAPFVLIIAFWIFMMRQMQAGGNKALSFGKSRARLLTAQQKKATFKDVAGIDEAKEELYEIIDFLKDPQKFQKLGGRIPKGVLLVGPPGTGKTLLARAIAGEANVPFFSISGSDFVEMFVGVGASRVRDLFEQGKKNAPCIIFIDEIDAVGRHRGAGLGGGH